MKVKTASILLIALALLLAGCVSSTNQKPAETPAPTTPAPTQEGQPYGSMGGIPIPLPGNYIAANTITSSNLAANSVTNSSINNNTVLNVSLAQNAVPFNFTQNISGTTITGTSLVPINVNGTIALQRNSALIVELSYDGSTTVGASGYVQVTTAMAVSNPTPMSPTIVMAATNYSVTAGSINFYNASVPAGTYNISLYAGTHNSAGSVVLTNITLITYALPT